VVRSVRDRWQRFEVSSDAYLSVTGMLLLLIVVPIVTPTDNGSNPVLTSVIAGGAATLAMAASQARLWMIRTAWIAWLAVIVAFIIPGGQGEVTLLASTILGLLLISAPFVILKRIARHEVVTATTMWGAIAAYLSLGIAFSFIYAAIYGYWPEAFNNVLGGGLGEFNYFSFVTLTTLGYGDITPIYESTRALVVFQTVIGQIFLVVVVARVVSLLGTGRRLGKERD